MAPPVRGRSLSRTSFSPAFSKLRTSTYTDITRPNSSALPSHYIRTLSWNATGTFIATGAADRTLRIWNPEKSNVKHSTELKGLAGSVERVLFHPFNENELASCTSDGSVRLWDVRTKGSVGELKLGGGPFTLAWAPNGNEIVVGTKDNTLVPVDRTMLKPIAEHKQNVQTNQCVFSWSGKRLFVTTGDGCVKILRYPSFEVERTLHAHTSSCFTLSMSPSGEYMAVGGGDALVSIWDTQDWICVRTLELVESPVKTVDFSFDGSYVVAGAEESKALNVAHVETGETVHTIELNHPASQIAWHPCRYTLAYSADKEGLKIVGAV